MFLTPFYLLFPVRKIKLAFRPGNVDLAEGQAAAIVIDDPRFFGNIAPDQDYPELEDAAFSQNMLSNYASLRAARGRTIASQHDTTQQEDFDYRNMADSRRGSMQQQSPGSATRPSPSMSKSGSRLINVGHIPGEEAWKHSDQSSRSRGRMSDIEMVREEGARASLSTLARSSMSSAGAGIVMGFDDDIPAFDEQMDDMAFGGNEPPQLDFYEDDAMMMADADYQAQEPVIDEYRRPRGLRKGVDEGVDEEGPFEESKSDRNNKDAYAAREDEEGEEEERKVPKARGSRGKRQKVTVDGVVELSGKLIKQRMADVGPILRRRPGDLLPRLACSASAGPLRPAVPPSVQGLCPELQALFLMTMIPSNKRLPFPLKPGATGLSAGAAASRQSSSSSVKARASLDVEAMRDNDASIHDLDSRRWSSASVGAADEAAMEDFGADNRMSTLREPQDHDFGGGGDMYDGGYDPMMGAEDVEQFHAGVDDYANADVYQDDVEGGGTGGALFGCLGKRPTDHDEEEEGRLPDWSSRTAMVFDVLQDQLKEQDSVSFTAISKGISRRTAAACFLEILQLKTWGFIDVAQDKPFADITINPTTKFWDKGTELAKM